MGEVMNYIEHMDLEDLVFFKEKVKSLNIDELYSKRLFCIIEKAIKTYQEIDSNLITRHSLYHSIWNEVSYFCTLLFRKKPDCFFNTLRAMEYEFAGRTLLCQIQLGWLVEVNSSTRNFINFLDI